MAKQVEAVSTENFKRKVSAVVRSGKSVRGNIQDLFHFAIVHYLNPENNGDLSLASYLYQQVEAVRSLNHKQLAVAFEDTINVKLRNTKAGDKVFGKARKGEEPTLLDGADLTASWWEISREVVVKDVDLLKLLEQAKRNIAATQGDEPKRKLVEDQECIVDDAIGILTDAITRLTNAQSIRNAAAEAEAGTVIKDIAA